MKRSLDLKPIIPKQMAIWDPGIILKQCLKHLYDEISLQLLSEKLVILLSILSGQRHQTSKALSIEHMVIYRL